MTTVYYCVNIELSFPETINLSLSRLGTLIRKRFTNVTYHIDNSQIPPHLTLHYMYLPESKLATLTQLINEVVNRNVAPEIEVGAIEAYRNGIISLPCKHSQTLENLHKDLVVTLESAREGSIDPDLMYKLKERPKTYRRNLEKYGYPYVMDEFRPHVALARVGKNVPFHELEDFVHDLNKGWVPINSKSENLAVRIWIESGGVGKTLAQYKLTQ